MPEKQLNELSVEEYYIDSINAELKLQEFFEKCTPEDVHYIMSLIDKNKTPEDSLNYILFRIREVYNSFLYDDMDKIIDECGNEELIFLDENCKIDDEPEIYVQNKIDDDNFSEMNKEELCAHFNYIKNQVDLRIAKIFKIIQVSN